MEYKLSDIAFYSKQKISVEDISVKNYVSTENMLPNKNGKIAATTLPKVKQTLKYEPNDVLISNIRPYFKKIWLANEEGGCSNDVLVLTAKNGIDPRYLYYVLANDKFFDYSMATSKGTKMPRGDKNSIMDYLVPSYPIDIQLKIASVLWNIDKKIRINKKINKNLLQQAQALFISWFVDYAPFGGKMPDNWENMSVYELADYINGAAFKKNEYADTGIPIIKIAELKNGITDSTQRCCVKKDEKYYIDDRDILFSWSGNPDTSIDTFIWSRGRAILNQHTFRVVSKYDAPAFTFFLLKYLKPQFTHIASNKQTTGLGHVTVADLKRLQFRANASVIAEFDAFVMPMFDLIYSKYKEIHQLSNLRDTLLPKLMSGEIDVSNLEL